MAAQQHRPKHSPWIIALAVIVPTFMEVMDTSIAAVCVPYIAGSTSSTNDEAEWVLTSYLVANAIFLPSSNWFAERFGRKRYLMTSIAIFTMASFAAGAAPTLPLVLIARAIQGAAGGALQPLSQAILLESFPKEKQGMALGFYALGVVLAPVIGPALGGYLTDAVSWRWAFYINVPVGIACLLLQSKVLEDPPEMKDMKPGPLDKWGLGLLAIWIGCLQYVLDKGQEDDWWNSTLIRWAAVFVALGFIAFIFRELTVKQPLVDLRALRNRNLAFGCALVFALGGVLYGLTTVLPVFFQELLGYSATASGFAVSPRGLGSVAASLIVGWLVSHIDPRYMVAAGFTTLAISGFWLGEVTLDISPTSLFWPIVVSGAALAMIFVPLSQVALGTLSAKETGNASGLFNFMRNIGGSIGISAANTIVARHAQLHRSEIVRAYTPANLAFRYSLDELTKVMLRHGGAREATLKAYKTLEGALESQAHVWSNVDVLRYFAALSALCAPFAFILKKPPKGKAPAAG